MSEEKRGLRHGKTLKGFCSNPKVNFYGRRARMEKIFNERLQYRKTERM